MRGFDHATILSPSFHGLRKKRLAQWPAFCVLNYEKKIPGGSVPDKLGGGVRHASWNPYPISEQKSVIFPTLFQTWSKIWYLVSDLKPWSPARDRSAWQAVRYGPRQRYGFLAVLVWNRVSISTILVWNRVWFVHSSLELGMFLRRTSHLFVIWR